MLLTSANSPRVIHAGLEFNAAISHLLFLRVLTENHRTHLAPP